MKKHANLKQVKYSYEKLQMLSKNESKNIMGGEILIVHPLYGIFPLPIPWPPVRTLYGAYPVF